MDTTNESIASSDSIIHNQPKIIVIIPAHNEERTVGGVVLSIKNQVNWDILVVDDFSGDSTANEACNAGAEVISLDFHQGAWSAIQTGLQLANQEHYDIVVTMDADGQHSARCLKDLVLPIVGNKAEVVIGVCRDRVGAVRSIGWRYFRRISGLSIVDLTSGFRAYSSNTFEVLLSSEASMLSYQDIGVLMLLRNAKMSIVEQKVEMFGRMVGTSRVYPSWSSIWIYVTQTTLLCISKISILRNRKDEKA